MTTASYYCSVLIKNQSTERTNHFSYQLFLLFFLQIDLHAKSKVGLADLYEKEWLDNHRKELEKAGQSTHELTEEEKEELKVSLTFMLLLPPLIDPP